MSFHPDKCNALRVKKANSSIGFLRRNLQIHQKHIKANTYKTLAGPQIEYASTIWDPFTQGNQNEIEMVQRRAARFACNNYRREASVTTMRDELGWRSLKQRRADQRLIMLYEIVNNLVEVDLSKELIPLTRHLEIVTPNPLKFPTKRKPIFNTAFYLEL